MFSAITTFHIFISIIAAHSLLPCAIVFTRSLLQKQRMIGAYQEYGNLKASFLPLESSLDFLFAPILPSSLSARIF